MASHPKVHIEEAILERLRPVCLELPEAVEAEAFGAPTFKIRNKNFAMLSRGDGRPAVWCKAAREAQQALIQSEPDRYFAPPYVGPKGWVAAWLDEDAGPDWDEIEEIIIESYCLIAPKKLVKLIED